MGEQCTEVRNVAAPIDTEPLTGVEALGAVARDDPRFPGEDPNTPIFGEMAAWISIYEELASVLRSVINRVGDSIHADVLRRDLVSIERRLLVWRRRHADRAGLTTDRTARTLAFAGRRVQLTRREAELLDFLLQHPQQKFTSKDLKVLAWQNPWLSEAQVRTYIMRLRHRLAQVELGHVIAAERNRGHGIGATPDCVGFENEMTRPPAGADSRLAAEAGSRRLKP
jgi:DNA-binding winged helix-turn-helix (wHTH) protein